MTTDQATEQAIAIVLRTWGTQIRRARVAAELSQADLGAILTPPVHQSTIARWEAGEVEPPLERKLQLARMLGVPTPTLFAMPHIIDVEAA